MSRARTKELPLIVKIVGKNIKRLILEKELKTRIVAHDANLDTENLRKYISGKQEMKISTLMRISEALQVPPEELLN